MVVEYILKASPRIIYNHVSTPWGLSEWFADHVNVKGSRYVFMWGDGEQEAELLDQKEESLVRFRWVEDEPVNEDTKDREVPYFEFSLSKDEMTNEVSLQVTDFADSPEDVEDLIDLWNSQIDTLKKLLGV